MSFIYSIDVFCDECGDWIEGSSGSLHSKREAWERASQNGWKKKKGQHICSVCLGTHGKYTDGGYYKLKEKYE